MESLLRWPAAGAEIPYSIICVSPGNDSVSSSPDVTSASSPVRTIPTDTLAAPAPGIALCLSGGGYRAMLFHLGALWRLNELAYLPKLLRISSVSGGSITAGVLGHRWNRLAFVDAVATRFDEEIVPVIRAMANATI